MNDPIRLLDEAPASALSSALSAERELSATLNGAALKSRVLANVAAGAVPSAMSVTASTWTSTALPTVLAGLIGVGIGVAGTLAVSDRTASVQSPVEHPVASNDVPAPPAPMMPPEPTTNEATETPTPRRQSTRVEPESAASRSTLVDETRRYERAAAALRDGRAAVAIDELRAYLRAYPTGALHDEVRLSLLEAYFAAGRFEDARSLGRTLSTDERLRDRRREIVRVLVKSELELHECGEAARALNASGHDFSDLREAVSRCEAGTAKGKQPTGLEPAQTK